MNWMSEVARELVGAQDRPEADSDLHVWDPRPARARPARKEGGEDLRAKKSRDAKDRGHNARRAPANSDDRCRTGEVSEATWPGDASSLGNWIGAG